MADAEADRSDPRVIRARNLRRDGAVLLATDHSCFDHDMIAQHAALIVDTWNAFGRHGVSAPHIVKA